MRTSDVLWALGGVAAVGGIGAIVYFATRPKVGSQTDAVVKGMTDGGASGGGTATPPPAIPPHVFTLSQVAGGSPGRLR